MRRQPGTFTGGVTMIIFALYAVLLVGLGLWDARHAGSAEAYFVNSRASGPWQVGLSITASCVGGSATIGMAGLAWQVGTPAFWWLGSGACGLLLLTVALARKVRASGALTLPELIGRRLGQQARTLSSLIIVIAWPAILAAQFTAMGQLTAALTGFDPSLALPAGALLIVLYALLGGQASVIRSDVPQFALLFGGLCLTMGWLFVHNPHPMLSVEVEVLNAGFGLSKFIYFFIIIGGSYVVCPMLFGRVLSARNERAAFYGGLIGADWLVVTAVVIVLVGLGCRGLLPPGSAPDSVLTAVQGVLPPWIGMALMVALLSAVLSSADSCLITASTVLCHDLLRTDRLAVCRVMTLALGGIGYLLSKRGHGILDLLLMANDVYVCGVVLPVFWGLMLPMTRHIPHRTATVAMLAGGAGGLASALLGMPEAGYAGLLASLLCLLPTACAGRDARQPAL